MIHLLHIGIFALHAQMDPLAGPNAHFGRLQLSHNNAAGTEPEYIAALLRHILLSPEKIRGLLQRYVPDFLFHHHAHL